MTTGKSKFIKMPVVLLIAFLLLSSANGVRALNPQNPLYVLHDDILYHIGPDAEELDRALNALFPQWASFRQTVPWWDEPISAGQVVEDASFDETFEINPAVTLVTVGMQLDWQPPADGDLFSRAQSVSEQLHGLFWKYARWKHLGEHKDEEAQARFQDVANAATYALYAFFHFDRQQLENWHETYRALFGVDPAQPPLRVAQVDVLAIEPFLQQPFENPENSFFAVNCFFDHRYPQYTARWSNIRRN